MHRNLVKLCAALSILASAHALLKVIDSPTRQVKSLDGFWDFLPDMDHEGIDQKWYEEPLDEAGPIRPMPVPSSYNDIGNDWELQHHVGWVWYEREFNTPALWLNKKGEYDPEDRKIYLRFESCHYHVEVVSSYPFSLTHSNISLAF